MNLKAAKEQIKKQLLVLIEKGSEARDEIELEYRQKRKTKEVLNDTLSKWNKRYMNWYGDCMHVYDELFESSILVKNKFKNPKMDLIVPSGENIRWVSIMKNFNARLEMLGDLYNEVAAIREEELSDYFEFHIGLPGVAGAKIKVDKILSKLL